MLNEVLAGTLRIGKAALLMGVSERHGWRVLAAYRREGVAAVAHGNRGRPPAHTLSAGLREQALTLAQTTYRGCNDSHLVELLAEREGLHVSRATFQRWRHAAGLTSPRTRRAPQHRSRRERMPQAGLLLQWDASPHAWLQDRGPRLTLAGAIDDATGEVVAATFRAQEDAQGYLLVLRTVLQTKGVPVAIYRDRHGIFERRAQDPWTVGEELTGERVPTQVGRALAELGIQSIAAHSPQAKGRIERLWGTLQDRLVAELRLANASTPEEAETVLQAYLPRFNRRFTVPPADPTPAYQPLPQGMDVEMVCCLAYTRTVAADNTISFGGRHLQLLPNPERASYARLTVDVREHLDGGLSVTYQGETLAVEPAPATAPTLRARQGRRALPDLSIPRKPGPGTAKPSPTHPWRTYPLT
ncbi:MAG TPA: ISNCY family transposase [Dehalococcoidia bacterium]|nr:ISNCY family transposase [Dehalococcoidia bacterium]